jgi:hypothetical protein
MDGFVHTHDAGFGARNPATSSHCGSSALDETFHPDGSTLLSPTAAGVDAVGEVVVTGAPLPGTTMGAGGFGAGTSEQPAATIAREASKGVIEERIDVIGAVA